MSKPIYVDLGDAEEDKRIDAIGTVAVVHRKQVAFVTDSDPGKKERYINKLKKKFPGIVIQEILPGPVPNTVTVKVGPPNAIIN